MGTVGDKQKCSIGRNSIGIFDLRHHTCKLLMLAVLFSIISCLIIQNDFEYTILEKKNKEDFHRVSFQQKFSKNEHFNDNCSHDVLVDIGKRVMLSSKELDMYRSAILNSRAMIKNGLKVDYLTEPALVTSIVNWTICGPMHRKRKLVPVPLTDAFIATWKNYKKFPELGLLSHLRSTGTLILDYLEDLEASIFSVMQGAKTELVFLASHGIVSDLPVHRFVMDAFDKFTKDGNESATRSDTKILVVATEIRIMKIEKKYKGYLTLNDDGSLSLVDQFEDFIFTASPLHENILKSFIIVPYFTTMSCADSMKRVVDRWLVRQFKVSFVGCIATSGLQHAGFGVRKFLKTAFNSSEDDKEHFSITDTCHGNDRRTLKSNTTWEIYDNSDFCLVTGGDSISSVRIYDAMSCLCIPIFTDGAAMLPFVRDIPWQVMSFYHEVRSVEDAIELRRKLVKCVSQEEIFEMRNIIAQHIHKLLWNWEGGDICPDWMRRPTSELPGGLLRKRLGEYDEQEVNIVCRMNMTLPEKC